MTKTKITPEEALAYHLEPRPGKYDVVASTPMATQRDLSLAYSPGVAVPVQAIADNPATAMTIRSRAIWLPSSRTGPPFWAWGTLGRSRPNR
jgi:malate dehydrogenase (oxaloacetate-decarboxylating)(NADP+)